MGILIDQTTRVLCQGFTGFQDAFHCEQAIADVTKMLVGVDAVTQITSPEQGRN
jgi:succinyl-CoA synthetase alpha subunit